MAKPSRILRPDAPPQRRRLWSRPDNGTMANPRPPALPAHLDLSLEQYYTACAAIGLLSSQHEEPDQDAAVEWSLEFGGKLARASRKMWGRK